MGIYSKLKQSYKLVSKVVRLWRYSLGGKKPWTTGFTDYRDNYIKRMIGSDEVIKQFKDSSNLNKGYGSRMDERVVEYPWIISKLHSDPLILMDAGSTLNHEFVLEHHKLRNKIIVIYNLSPEGIISHPNISYIYGDLRNTILKSEVFDVITCISVLEHIGMDNTLLYSKDTKFNEDAVTSHDDVIQEFRRVLKPGGKLLITVPYGKYENHGWLQQFDASMIDHVISKFMPSHHSVTYFKYSVNGWNISNASDCSSSHYYNVHANPELPSDSAAAARAVACIEMIK